MMAANPDTTTESGRLRLPRWSHPRQKMLSLLALGVTIGAFLPWLDTPIGTYRGFAGPGLYLFYVGIIGLGAGLVPIRFLALAQGAIMAAVAVALPVWQMAKLASKVGLTGWAPGIGMVMILGCGIMAGRIVYVIATDPGPDSA
jgi:hypothetical protein